MTDMVVKAVIDHGWPLASDGTDGHGLEAFKNERDYVAQRRTESTTVAAMDWAIREIERLRYFETAYEAAEADALGRMDV